ncbi:acyltransferase [Sphingomonas oleivorans]|uniref:Acyltransferase n=1 Tax=Sphingomonas oleivorans TaxID=1735121 RepID=A0A2T5FZ83_9SPHN|nr:acyltransferase [Sphingomonas oleivorans]
MDRAHIFALDGLRGVAALLVLSSHFGEFGIHALTHHRIGDYGVMIFFVLSGFLMGHLYLHRAFERDEVVRYIAARVARIAPLYLLVALASFLICRFVDPGFAYPVGWGELIRLLSFTSVQPIFWSTGPEFQFYFLFLPIWLAFAARSRSANMLPLLLVAGCSMLIYMLSPATPGFSVFSKMHIFLTGIGVALLRARIGSRLGAPVIALLQAAALLFLIGLVSPPQFLSDFLYPELVNDPKHVLYYGDLRKVLACGLLILAFSFRNPLAGWLLENRAMRLIGAYSFSIYLLHMPLLYWIAGTGAAQALPYPLLVSLILLAVIAVSALSFHLIENPARRHVRRGLIALAEKMGRKRRRPGTQPAFR